MRVWSMVMAWMWAMPAWAETGEAEIRTRWSARHPVQLGVKAVGGFGAWSSGGVGGWVAVRPLRHLGLQLFSDNTLRLQPASYLHHHVIGFRLFAPVLDTRHISLSPTMGMCVDFAVDTPRDRDAPGAQDVRFGQHAGALLEVHAGRRVSVVLEASAYLYLGRDMATAGWTAQVSPGLQAMPAGSASLGIAYAL